MTASLNMIRGRSNIVTLTNNSGGALIAGDVVVQDTSADEKVTTTTSAASVLKVFVAAESIASGAAGRFYESGYCPLVNVSASVTRGRFLFTHTVAKQAAENATYGSGAFGKILKSGTTPSAIIYSATAQTAGGSGNVTTTSAYASPPSPASGDVWFPNDSFYITRYSGAAQAPWGPIFPMTPPPAVSGLTWVNQGGATATETNGGIYLLAPAGAGNNLRILKKAVTAPYIITAALIPQAIHANYVSLGILGRQSSDGKITTCALNIQANDVFQIAAYKYSGASGSVAVGDYATISPSFRVTPCIWLRLADNNTNRIYSWSCDGQNWMQLHSVGRTDYLTCDEVGFFVDSNNASYAAAMTLLSWLQT